MTKEELEKEANKALDKRMGTVCYINRMNVQIPYTDGYKDSAEPREKRIEELEQKISVLLSCKNCPKNKGGFICQKEYEDKCLAQKIQYIKELQEENENLKKTYRKQRNKRIDDLQKENAELRNNGFTVSAMTEQQLKVALEKGEQLEKENAELKTDYEVLSCSVGDFGELQNKLEEEQRKNNGLSDNLTKAKEIICEYVRLANLEKEDTVAIWQLYHKAEQFLKNCEVEK